MAVVAANHISTPVSTLRLLHTLQAQLEAAKRLEEEARKKREAEKQAALTARTEIALNSLIPLVAPGGERPGLLQAVIRILERNGDDVAVRAVVCTPTPHALPAAVCGSRHLPLRCFSRSGAPAACVRCVRSGC